jgi:outer membrane autotransporter protein
VRTRRGLVRAALPLVALLAWTATASAQGLINLGTLPGLTSSQARVGTAIDTICPKLGAMSQSLNPAQTDLFNRCSDMKTPNGLGVSVLPDVLSKVSQENNTAEGNSAVETKSAQLRTVGARLGALRLGASGVSINGFRLDQDSRVAAADTVTTDTAPPVGGLGVARTGASPLGLFVNGVGSFGNKDTTSREVGFDFHTVGVTAGADYRFTDRLVAGVALSYLRSDADLTSSLGEVDSNTYGLALYGTYYFGPMYLDLLGGFTRSDYDISRRIVYGPAPGGTGAPVNRTAKGDTDGWQYTFNGGAGYDARFGALTVTPYVRVEYLHLDIDAYTETGANGLDLKVQKQTVESLLTVLGGRTSYAISTPFGVLLPQIRAEWRHEVLDDQRSIKAQFANDPFNVPFLIATDSPDRDYFALGAGIAAALARGVSAFIDFETIVGLKNVTNHNFIAGVRFEF